jgi:polysaccharide pyruvyl transferase WcaK-like protein
MIAVGMRLHAMIFAAVGFVALNRQLKQNGLRV